MAVFRRVAVFCGSSTGRSRVYQDAAERLARVLAARQIGLVFGGGRVGLLGVIADAMLAAGGHVIGVIPEAMVAREIAHKGLADLRVVASMHERKAMMAALSDAFVALPGGFGTFEELCEAITWTQLGLHRKRCGLLNVDRFYDPLLAQFDRAVADGFLKAANRSLVADDADRRRCSTRYPCPLRRRSLSGLSRRTRRELGLRGSGFGPRASGSRLQMGPPPPLALSPWPVARGP